MCLVPISKSPKRRITAKKGVFRGVQLAQNWHKLFSETGTKLARGFIYYRRPCVNLLIWLKFCQRAGLAF